MNKAPGPTHLELFRRFSRGKAGIYELDDDLRRQFGDIVRINLPKVKHLLYHPQYFEYILKTNAKNYRRDSQLKPLLGESIVTTEGEYWKRQKRILGREFHASQFERYYDSVLGIINRFIDKWRERQEINASLEFMDFSLKIAAETFFGSKVSDRDVDVVRESMKIMSEYAIKQIYSPITIPGIVPTPGKVNVLLAANRIKAIIDNIIEENKLSGAAGESENVLTRLMEAKEGESLTDKQLKSETFSLLLAGHETTSAALSWVFYLIARHSEYIHKLQDEIDRVVGDEAPTLEHLGSMPILNGVVLEALRLYPPFPLLTRTAIEDDEIGGFHIPAGSRVYCMTFLAQRREELWDGPSEFQPGRYQDGMPPAFHLLPFGGGMRKCIGPDFATFEMKLLIIRFLQTFTPRLLNRGAVEPQALVTLTPSENIVLGL